MLLRRCLLPMTVVSVAAATPAVATASEPSFLGRFSYEVGRGCPTEEEFVDGIRRYVRSQGAEHSARELHVRIEGQAPSVRGDLSITNDQGKITKRTLAGPDCEAVARGLAVVAALTIDPRSGGPPSSPPPGRAPTPETGAAVDDTAALSPPPRGEFAAHESPADERAANGPPSNKPSGPAPTVATLPAAERPSHPTASARARPSQGRSRTPLVQWTADVRAELTSAVVPGWLPMLGVAGGIVLAPRRVPAWVRPSVAVGFRQSASKTADASRGSADFVLTAATLRACPVRASMFVERLEIVPCVEGELGALQAEGYELADARRTTNVWLSAGASVLASLRIADRWFASANLLVSRPLSRYRFELEGGAPITHAPSLGLTLGLGSSLRF